MRVIGGKAKGRRLKVPHGRRLRPTADRVKEALFNILPRDLSEVRVLELFAGTGSLSIEALSRGAAEALLVDASARTAEAMRENLHRLELTDRAAIRVAPVARALRALAKKGERFDMIFLDPPYDQRLAGGTVSLIDRTAVLRAGGVVVVEHSVREPLKDRYGSLVLSDRRRYGDTLLSFYRPADTNESNSEGL